MSRAVLFDLDGTLVDTRLDLAASLNAVLRRMGRPERTLDEVTAFIGDGVRSLMERGLGPDAAASDVDEAVALFRPYYDEHCAERSVLYPGVRRTLEALRGAKTAVVTNKPESASRTLLSALGVLDMFPVVIGGDTLSERKPSPAPVLDALRRLNADPRSAWMVGDSANDMRAGRAAGIRRCAVLYGYRPAEELEAERPDATVEKFSQLEEVLR